MPGHVELPTELKNGDIRCGRLPAARGYCRMRYTSQMEIVANGELIPVRQGSTKPVSMMVYGAEPHETRRFEFPAPRF